MSQSILAIDDSPEIHQLLEVRIKPEALDIHHALDAIDGMRKALTLQPDLILLDVDMPGVSGFELCQRLKADPRTSAIPIIFLTGAVAVATKVKGFDLGAVDYVTKPFDAAELRARVRAALRTKRYQDLLTARAHLDALTGLWNRAHFNQQLANAIDAARRYGRRACLVMLDLDHFKNLNDTYGHPFGDQVLQAVGEALAASVRAVDAACRYGGEEFAIILDETSVATGLGAAQRMREELAKLDLRPKGVRVPIKASIGVAATEQFGAPAVLTGAGLVGAADRALYAAKHAGRDRVCMAVIPIEAGLEPDLSVPTRAAV
jgi:diguanylate cyclase (GGDEF)-like protein